jgi:hypothetical protein
MKKTMLALFGAALLVAVPSCKKGANDPALSLKSRKSRLAGEYSVSKLDETTYDTWGSDPSTTVYTYDGGATAISTTTSGGTKTTETIPISLYEFTFDKDGTWEERYNYQTTNSYTSGGSDIVQTTDHVTVRTGTWAFIGKTNGDYKNKERIQMSILSDVDDWSTETVTTTTFLGQTSTTTDNTTGKSSNTYSALEYVMIYAIDMLKNKEMTFTYEENNLTSSTDNSGTTTTNEYTVEETMTLTQK